MDFFSKGQGFFILQICLSSTFDDVLGILILENWIYVQIWEPWLRLGWLAAAPLRSLEIVFHSKSPWALPQEGGGKEL